MTFLKYIQRRAKESGISTYDLFSVLEGNVHVNIPETLQKLYDSDVDNNSDFSRLIRCIADGILYIARLKENPEYKTEMWRQMDLMKEHCYHLFVEMSGSTKMKQTFNMSIKDYFSYLEQIDEWADAYEMQKKEEEPWQESDEIKIFIKPDAEKMKKLNNFLEQIAI